MRRRRKAWLVGVSGGTGEAVGTLEHLEARVLLAADPVTPDHPFWAIPRGSAVIDGELDDWAWSSAAEVFRTNPTTEGASWVRMLWDAGGLYLAAEVQDRDLWADGLGGGAGNRWEIETDDSIQFAFDADGSRDLLLQPEDRVFGVSVAPADAPINGSGAVRRYRYVEGTGDGGAFDVIPGGDFEPGIVYATSVRGTINDPSDVDEGWTVEVFLPWSAVGLTGAPAHGQTMAMNFIIVFDNDGGTRNLTDNRSGPDRYLLPHVVDDYILGAHSSYHATQAIARGPVSYAEAMFVDSRAGARPPAIGPVEIVDITPYGGLLGFDAPPATLDGRGHVSGYEVRYSTTGPINTDAAWLRAQEFENARVPRLAGLRDSLRIIGLEPDVQYHVSIRAVDAAGNLGVLPGSLALHTEPLPRAEYAGHVTVSPRGRTLVMENGDPFIIVGDHVGVSWRYTRHLWPGTVWDNENQVLHNFHDDIDLYPQYNDVEGYFQSLEDHGVNTMRVYFELQDAHVEGNPYLSPDAEPEGVYWMEWRRGMYNESVRGYIHNLLDLASQHGVYLVISPYSTFKYDESFGIEGPWATNFGGPLTDIDDFFQNPETLEMAKARADQVIAWVNEHPYADHVIGWEPLSEYNSYEWTLNDEGDSDPGRETEMRRRAIWINELAAHFHQADPTRLVLNSPVARDPRGPIARVNFYSTNFDVNVPHLYTLSTSNPLLNPAADDTALAAREHATFTSYYISSLRDNRPTMNMEWGVVPFDWPYSPRYSDDFPQSVDEAIYRSMLWTGLASGQPGTAMRLSGVELSWNGHLLSDEMRDSQLVVSRFVNGAGVALDWANFTGSGMTGRISATGAGHSLMAWGFSDGAQGVAYVQRDGNVSSGAVSGATLRMSGLRRDQLVDVEVWSTSPGAAGPSATVSGKFVQSGEMEIALPAFSHGVAIKFRARPSQVQTQKVVSLTAKNYLVSFAVGVDGQPIAQIIDTNTDERTTQDVAALSNFRGRVVDMTPYTTPFNGWVHVAVTDENHHLWTLSGNISTQQWTATDRTAELDGAGMTGDLTVYQPRWGAIHISGLDARGSVINYGYIPANGRWQFNDLSAVAQGPALAGGLTAYIAQRWNGLNLVGVNDGGEVIVYWWSPQSFNEKPDTAGWQISNLTVEINGPRLVGQLDAFVTGWLRGLNIAGTTTDGGVAVYRWEVGGDGWTTDDITELSGGPESLSGLIASSSGADQSVTIFALDSGGGLRAYRTIGATRQWDQWDVTTLTGGATATLPLSAASAADRVIGVGPSGGSSPVLVTFTYTYADGQWRAEFLPVLVAV